MPGISDNEKVSEYASRVGLIPGDIYTFVVFAEREDMAYVSPISDDALASLNYCVFGWVRMIVKSDVLSNTSSMANLSSIFDFQTSGGDFDTSKSGISESLPDDGVSIWTIKDANAQGYTDTGAIGVIRSRLDQDLRSDSELHMIYGSTAADMFGIASDYILQTWESGTTAVGDSTLILEGGNG